VREFWFESEGVRLFAVEDGVGPAIVMLHGGMGSYLASLPLIAPLTSRYRVIAPDLRGSGRSWSGARSHRVTDGHSSTHLQANIGVKRSDVKPVDGVP
jgi:pimeloyl-ACP methyl ester carboxylesterase